MGITQAIRVGTGTVRVEIKEHVPTYEQACLEIVLTAERVQREIHEARHAWGCARFEYYRTASSLDILRKNAKPNSRPLLRALEQRVLKRLDAAWAAQERYYDLVLKYEGRDVRGS